MKVLRVLVVFLGSSTLFLAAQPVATVTSSSAFELQGHTVNVAGVPSWPVAAGDVVATHSATATIQLRDGSRLTLLEGSKLRIDSTSEDGLKIDLLAGSLKLGSSLPKQASFYIDGRAAKGVSGGILTSHRPVPPVSSVPRNGRTLDFPTPVSSR